MAIPIKSAPILTKSAARNFERQATFNMKKKSTIDFTQQCDSASRILLKAKI